MNGGSGNSHGGAEPDSGLEFALPSQELARQAVATLRGYAYQLYQSVLAWITLDQLEELHLEVAEDYAVLSGQALSLTQVKDTPSISVTLNSRSAQKAIQSLWDLQGANPTLLLKFRFLTTAT